MATVVAHENVALHDISSSSLHTPTSCGESTALRSKSSSPESGTTAAVANIPVQEHESASTIEPSDKSQVSIATKPSGPVDSKPDSKPKIFDNKVFVEAPPPKKNPWIKPSATPAPERTPGMISFF
jgi:hypothetical protein